MNNKSVLIIDDEAQIRKLLTITLQSNDYQVDGASTAKAGLESIEKHVPDLVLLDLGLPDESGHEVLTHLRKWFINPIVILSAQSSKEDILKALDNGANDYIVKPFRTEELLSRIRLVMGKSQIEKSDTSIIFNDLSIDFISGTVKRNNAPLKLTTAEYSLFSLFVKNEGKVLTHQYILNNLKKSRNQNETQELKITISQLREKIENDPNRPRHILTESGVGYRFVGNNPAT